MRNLWRFMWFSMPYWREQLVGFFGGLGRLVVPLYLPIFVKNVIDHVLAPAGLTGAQRWEAFRTLLPLLLVLLAIHPIMVMIRFYLPNKAAIDAVRDVRFELFRHIQRMSISFYNRRPTGAVVARVMNDVGTAQAAFEQMTILAGQQLLQMVVAAVYLMTKDWKWALVSFAAVPIFVVATRILRGRIRAASRETQDSVERVSGYLQERVGMIRETQSFTAEGHEERTMREEVDLLRDHMLRRTFYNGLLVTASEMVRYAGELGVIAFGIYRYLQGKASVGEMTVFITYSALMLNPALQLSLLYGAIQSAAAAADRVFEYFDERPEIADKPGAKPLVVTQGRVQFQNVSFSYPTDQPVVVLKDLNLEVPAGARVALVGKSGGGKSTLINLLPRFYDVADGRVAIDGQDVRDVALPSLRQAIGIVPQEPVLFTGTIRENILYGRIEGSDAEVRQAARLANAEEFILRQPQGYETVVGERGANLSGGQVQRLAIARMFLKNPPILILDEATSNLDALSEALVLDALDRLLAGRTSFTIAHRLSVARHADIIVVLNMGQLAEKGTHDELMARNGLYADLWRQQMSQA